jgi:hypothetical protein
MTAKYFTTADGRIVRGEVVSLPVLAVNYEVGIAEYVGESSSMDDARGRALDKGFDLLTYDYRPAPKACVVQSGHPLVASNAKTYHEWIEVPVASKVKS